MLTAAWLFVRHGRSERARVIVEALQEENPRDGVSADALAELLLASGEAERALEQTGRTAESERRWKRYLASKKGERRSWI